MKPLPATLTLVLVSVLPATSQRPYPATPPAKMESPHQETPPAYREAVLALMLREASAYATSLGLPEDLPLNTQRVQEAFIAPPHLAARFGAVGSLRTASYSYGFGKGKLLSYITRIPKDKSQTSLYERMKPWAMDPSTVAHPRSAEYMRTRKKQFLITYHLSLSLSLSL